jgi:hypothetical protein
MPEVYHGNKAVRRAREFYQYKGRIDPLAENIILEEGFVVGSYDDDRGIETEGVGLTGEFRGRDFFRDVFPEFVARCLRLIPNFYDMPYVAQKAAISGVYRGDLGRKTAALLREGAYGDAAMEYLNHAGYRRRKNRNPNDGVVLRMERNAAAFLDARD